MRVRAARPAPPPQPQAEAARQEAEQSVRKTQGAPHPRPATHPGDFGLVEQPPGGGEENLGDGLVRALLADRVVVQEVRGQGGGRGLRTCGRGQAQALRRGEAGGGAGVWLRLEHRRGGAPGAGWGGARHDAGVVGVSADGVRDGLAGVGGHGALADLPGCGRVRGAAGHQRLQGAEGRLRCAQWARGKREDIRLAQSELCQLCAWVE